MKKHVNSAGGERVVAIGLLTAQDVNVLGTGFKRLFPVPDNADFADLLQALEKIELGPASEAPRPDPA